MLVRWSHRVNAWANTEGKSVAKPVSLAAVRLLRGNAVEKLRIFGDADRVYPLFGQVGGRDIVAVLEVIV